MSVSSVPAAAPAAAAPAPAATASAAPVASATTQTAATSAAPALTTTPGATPTVEPAKPAFDWNAWDFDYSGEVPEEHKPVADRLRKLHEERLTTAQQEAAAERDRLQTIAKFWQNAAGGGDEEVDILGIQQEAQELRDAKARGEITEQQLREEMQKLTSEIEELRGYRDSFENQVRDHVTLMATERADKLWAEMESPAVKFLEGSVEGDEKHQFYDALVENITEDFPLDLIGPIFSADMPTQKEFMELFQEGMRADKAFARAQKSAAAREKAGQEKVDTVLTGPSRKGSVPLRGGPDPQERPRPRVSFLNPKFK